MEIVLIIWILWILSTIWELLLIWGPNLLCTIREDFPEEMVFKLNSKEE